MTNSQNNYILIFESLIAALYAFTSGKQNMEMHVSKTNDSTSFSVRAFCKLIKMQQVDYFQYKNEIERNEGFKKQKKIHNNDIIV